MSEDLVVETNGPYLRVVLPDFEPDWAEVWSAVDFELEDGIERAEVIAPLLSRRPQPRGRSPGGRASGAMSCGNGRGVAGPASGRAGEGVVRSRRSWAGPNHHRDQRPVDERAL